MRKHGAPGCGGAKRSIVVVFCGFLAAFFEHGWHWRVALCVLPEDHVELFGVGAVGVAEVHLPAFFRAFGLFGVGSVDQVVVAVGIIGAESGLIACACEQRGDK